MFGGVRIECVLRQGVCAAEERKAVGGHDHVDIPTHGADGAVAVFNLESIRKGDFKAHSAAMAPPLVTAMNCI